MSKPTIQEMQSAFEGKYQKFQIQSTECRWARVHKPDEGNAKYSIKPAWKIDLLLSEAQYTEMKAIGFPVKEKEGEYFITAKRKVHNPDGTLRTPPVVEFPDGTPCTDAIGNGSIVTVHCSAKFFSVAGKTHLPLYFDKVVVENLVAFNGAGSNNIVF